MQFILAFHLLLGIHVCQAFWWPFSSSEEEEKPGGESVTSLQSVFAPFEVTEVETKFLAEAAHYLGNLPKLDQCNLLVSYKEEVVFFSGLRKCFANDCITLPYNIPKNAFRRMFIGMHSGKEER